MKYMFSLFAELKISQALIGVMLCSIFLIPHAARATSFYIDDKGIVIFVEDESMIPDKYKGQKTSVESGAKEGLPVGDNKGIDSPVLKTKTDKPEIKDKFGNTPSYWRQRYKGLLSEKEKKDRELRDFENQRDELGRKYESVRSRAYFVGDSQSVTEAATLELKVRELENMIKITLNQLDALNKKISVDIYDELTQAGGSSDWLLRDE